MNTLHQLSSRIARQCADSSICIFRRSVVCNVAAPPPPPEL